MATSRTTNSTAKEKSSKPIPRKFVLSVQAERFYKGLRYHWMVCLEHDPEQLISWGHAPTQQLAEAAGQLEISDLIAGLSQGGQVVNNMKPANRWR